jgi:hypothetical protein
MGSSLSDFPVSGTARTITNATENQWGNHRRAVFRKKIEKDSRLK